MGNPLRIWRPVDLAAGEQEADVAQDHNANLVQNVPPATVENLNVDQEYAGFIERARADPNLLSRFVNDLLNAYQIANPNQFNLLPAINANRSSNWPLISAHLAFGEMQQKNRQLSAAEQDMKFKNDLINTKVQQMADAQKLILEKTELINKLQISLAASQTEVGSKDKISG